MMIVSNNASGDQSLSPIVRAFIAAVNASDKEGVVETLAGDAVVNDQLDEYCGSYAIRGWIEREIIARRLTLTVVATVRQYVHDTVTAEVRGNFDRRGLPDPLITTFYFSSVGERIVQLIILRISPHV
jgi:hypothetical protein